VVNGIARGQLFREKSLHRVLQLNTDGAIARFYNLGEWKKEVDGLFTVDSMQVCGAKTELFPLPAGKIKNAAMSITPDVVSKFFTNTLRFGHFLVAKMTVQKQHYH
jgi:hypothetical protein